MGGARFGFVLVVALAVTASGGPSWASGIETALQRELRGAWGVLAVEVYSGCAGFYTNNHAGVGGVASKGDRRFAAGELVKVDKLNLKRARVDLFLTLAEPVLVSRYDGPFELFDELECQVQLMIEVPRPLIRADDVGAVLEIVRSVIEVHPTLEQARSSPAYNRRAREPYPEDYGLTVARHAVWQAEQINAAVAARSEEALADAIRVADDVERDPAYLDGFAAGVEAMESWYERDCDDLIDVRFSSVEDSPPGDRRDDDDWCDGFRDGQALVFNLRLVERLGGCFVPVPPPPIPEP